MNNNITISNNQAFSNNTFNKSEGIIDILSGWADRSFAKIRILDYIIKNISCFGVNSHPSQTTIGKKVGVKRGWVNIVTNELVSMGLITKTRIIIDGEEKSCEYALTPFLKDRSMSWILKNTLPSLKLLHVLSYKKVDVPTDNTPYNKYYIYKNFKILNTVPKSIFRSKKVQLSKNRENSMVFYNPTNSNLYDKELSNKIRDNSLRSTRTITNQIHNNIKTIQEKGNRAIRNEYINQCRESNFNDIEKMFARIICDNLAE